MLLQTYITLWNTQVSISPLALINLYFFTHRWIQGIWRKPQSYRRTGRKLSRPLHCHPRALGKSPSPPATTGEPPTPGRGTWTPPWWTAGCMPGLQWNRKTTFFLSSVKNNINRLLGRAPGGADLEGGKQSLVGGGGQLPRPNWRPWKRHYYILLKACQPT